MCNDPPFLGNVIQEKLETSGIDWTWFTGVRISAPRDEVIAQAVVESDLSISSRAPPTSDSDDLDHVRELAVNGMR